MELEQEGLVEIDGLALSEVPQKLERTEDWGARIGVGVLRDVPICRMDIVH